MWRRIVSGRYSSPRRGQRQPRRTAQACCKAREASEADGKILVRAPDRVMQLTGYSPMK